MSFKLQLFKPFVNYTKTLIPLRKPIFISGERGFHKFRIPVLVYISDNILLAFSEARNGLGKDWDPSALVYKRSIDGGTTWSEIIVIEESNKTCINNPCAIVDYDASVPNKPIIHLLYCTGYSQVFYCVSEDIGLSFQKKKEITEIFKPLNDVYPWSVIAIGPVHGLRHSSGRLIAPVWLSPNHSHHPSTIITIYSEDHGKSWLLGEIPPYSETETPSPNESVLAELSNGEILWNIRHVGKSKNQVYRALSRSKTGFSNWTPLKIHKDLPSVICQGSMINLNFTLNSNLNSDIKHILISSNSTGITYGFFGKLRKSRSKGCFHVSFNNGLTWPKHILYEPSNFGYSDIAYDGRDKIFSLYEGKIIDRHDNKRKSALILATFSLKDLLLD